MPHMQKLSWKHNSESADNKVEYPQVMLEEKETKIQQKIDANIKLMLKRNSILCNVHMN